jgi:hypothetical protein
MSLYGDCSYLSDAHINFLNKINKDKKQNNKENKEYNKGNSNYHINSIGNSMSLTYYNNNTSVCKVTSQ